MLAEKLQRAIVHEFLTEDGLFREAGLERLPDQLGRFLGLAPAEALSRLQADPSLASLSLEQIRRVAAIRDMTWTSRTAAALTRDLSQSPVSYERCCRTALVYAVAQMTGHTFAALRAAAAKHDDWARHHYIYGLVLGSQGQSERALWELGAALQREPYEEGRVRIRRAIDLIETADAA